MVRRETESKIENCLDHIDRFILRAASVRETDCGGFERGYVIAAKRNCPVFDKMLSNKLEQRFLQFQASDYILWML